MSDIEQDGLSRRRTLARIAALAIGAYAAPALTTLSMAQASSGSGGGSGSSDGGGSSGSSKTSAPSKTSTPSSAADSSSGSTCSGPTDDDAGCSDATPVDPAPAG